MADKFFPTVYKPPMFVLQTNERFSYGNGVWASSMEEARAVVELRNVPGEEVEDLFAPLERSRFHPAHHYVARSLEEPESLPRYLHAEHALIFLCYIAQCAGILDHHCVTGDGGLLHEFLHVISKASTLPQPHEKILISVLRVEALVPGYLSKEQKDDASRYCAALQQRIASQAGLFSRDLI